MKKPIIAATVAAAALAGSAQYASANDAVRLMTEFYEVADTRPFDMAALSAFYADDYADHHPNPALPADGPNALVFQLIADGAPDSFHNIEMIIPSGDDKAIVVWTHEGTNTDGFFGVPVQDPPLPFAIAGIEIWGFNEDGKITDLWHVEDIAGLMATAEPKLKLVFGWRDMHLPHSRYIKYVVWKAD